MQKSGLKIQLLLLLVGCVVVWGQTPENLHQKADSLYQQKKYSEASLIYFDLYSKGYQSPSTLLKMAYVHEGLKQNGKALFFLSIYYKLTEDARAYEKIVDLANKNNVAGYELTPAARFKVWVNNRKLFIVGGSVILALFFLSLAAYSARHGNANGRYASGFMAIVFMCMGLIANWELFAAKNAVVTQSSLLMAGPSAAAPLVGIIAEGSPVEILEQHDIWSKTDWNGKRVYIRSADLLKENQ